MVAGHVTTCFHITKDCKLTRVPQYCAGAIVRHSPSMRAIVTVKKRGARDDLHHAERMIRFGVLWRKRSQGTNSEKGNRWVERILSLRQTCRLQGKSTYSILVEAMEYYFKDQQPDLEWIRQAG